MRSVLSPLRDPEPAIDPSREPNAHATPARVKVLYIAGYGRSGTTLLDIALGEHPAVMGGGEIATLARHVWANDEYCACGASVRACPVWREIVTDWRAGEPPTLIDDYRRAQERTETILGLGRIAERWRGDAHAARTVKLLRAVVARSARPVVVDSSKLPGRALALAAMEGIELFVVHVVRDPRGVAWSLNKAIKRQVDKGVQRELRPKPLAYTALRWSIVNLATEWLCRRVGPGRHVRVRYEEFVADPPATLARILTLVGERPVPSVLGAPMVPQHQVAGSRHRMQSAITIASDERWKTAMPRLRRWWVTLLTAPLLRRYGYALGVPAEDES
ncbi:sulfotransferase family protein [Sphingomonas sp. EC-HK361]|uniref:sulfotransferase family protein n=1 Tax=Sphingomonas sp. EC-HK361 TaxID=2038397 RepID=UPI001F326D75|nr:sulfotransferase [Sphingomonas sp. EC-HK361]